MSSAARIWLIRTTFANKDEALSTARTLLEAHLVACANIQEGSVALYHWEDMIQQEQETVALFKTIEPRVAEVLARIKTLHTYQLPSILAWPAQHADPSFADWVATEVRSPHDASS